MRDFNKKGDEVRGEGALGWKEGRKEGRKGGEKSNLETF